MRVHSATFAGMPSYRLLPETLRPLVDKFYRYHRSPMRSQAGDALWVAQDANDILAALSLRPVAEGQWLTGLFVAPAQRRQGLAQALLHEVLERQPEPIWLFCHPNLEGFYQRQGFMLCEALPAPLAERLARYSRSKKLVAMRAH